jgi:hypothetical protein
MRRLFLLGLATAAICGTGPCLPLFSAPVPPEQSQQWEPPSTTLPPVAIDAVAQLFKDGLPDPRGCEYREIEIAESPTWRFKTHGWVLPGTDKQKYAIAWNGVIYPVTWVGKPIDLAKEIAALPKNSRQFRGNGSGLPADDISSADPASSEPLHIAFLLRLGLTQQAEQMWTDCYAGEDDSERRDPYVEMAVVWLDRWFNRATQSFLNGDDTAALAICRQISPVVGRVEATAKSRGLADSWQTATRDSLLWQLPWLEADLVRLRTEAPYLPVFESELPAHGPERIATLIRDLEQSRAHQYTNPGETEITDDPTVQELEKEGYPAVEPLLKCLVEDNRLTRARYTAGMFFEGPIIPVYEAAYKALFNILHVSIPLSEGGKQDYQLRQIDVRGMSSEARKALAAKLTAEWDQIRKNGVIGSAYLALQDDGASPEDWFRAIDNIVQPADGTYTDYLLIHTGGSYFLHGSAPLQPRGESLRSKTNPSVSDLIIKRFEQLAQKEPAGSPDIPQLGKVLLALQGWDGKAQSAALRRLAGQYRNLFPRGSSEPSTVDIELCEKRLQLGDSTGLTDYLDYLQSFPPDDLKDWRNEPEKFEILWHYPDDAGVRQTVAKLFVDPKSALVPIPHSLVPTPLIGVPAFRQELLRGLDDKSPAGTVEVQSVTGDSVSYRVQDAFGYSSCNSGPNEPNPPKVGLITTLRMCDDYADGLAQITGFPAFKPYWPEAKRDDAISAAKALLSRYGDALKGRATDSYTPGSFDPTKAAFRFERLDHPATADDVKAGRAIFSLPGKARLWKMPAYPFGPAWQAEEALVDGKWTLYYGVIRDGRAEKVAARDMDFPSVLLDGVSATKQIRAKLVAPEDIDRSHFTFTFAKRLFVPAGEPVPIHIEIGNHNGEEQTVPAALAIPSPTSKALPAGVTLSLAYSGKIPPRMIRFEEPQFDFGSFEEIPLRKGVVAAPEVAPGPKLLPMQVKTIFSGDLRDYFDLSRPGTYQLQARFHVPGQPIAKTQPLAFFISPAKP